ncbi:acidic phospholipase A2 DE-II-like [Diadema setosum]|uniref:acidic phospholipase A2 DE-II-like n=1 Tax=Diadema setosum TaxID=31175 RepID=UPI003B3BC79B
MNIISTFEFVASLLLLSANGKSAGLHIGGVKPEYNDGRREAEVSHDLSLVVNLDNMMSCTSNRTFWETFRDFAFYGCYCGVGGWGTPVDGVDRCCQQHDRCYAETHFFEGGSCYLSIISYVIPYKFQLHHCGTANASVTCAKLDDYKWYKLLPQCAVDICNCDRQIAICLTQNTFHEQYRFYDRLKCFNVESNVSDSIFEREIDHDASFQVEEELP